MTHPTPAELIKDWIEKKTNVVVYLVNGVKLNGYILSYVCDKHTPASKLVLERNGHMQVVYEHAISTVSPVVFVAPNLSAA